MKKKTRFTSLCLILMLTGGIFFGHEMPASISEANKEFAARKINLVRAWALRFAQDAAKHSPDNPDANPVWPTGYEPWGSKGNSLSNQLRRCAAGLYMFTHPGEFTHKDFSLFSGLPEESDFEAHKEAFKSRTYEWMKDIEEYKTVGTAGTDYFLFADQAALYHEGPETGAKIDGDYDFALVQLAGIIYTFKDFPDVLTNDMIWEILSHSSSVRRKLIIEKVECKKNEDDFNRDECFFKIKADDGEEWKSGQHQLKQNETWNDINIEQAFDNTVRVKLIDRDKNGGPDDELGTVIIDNKLKLEARAFLTKDEVFYILTYSVVPDLSRPRGPEIGACLYADGTITGGVPATGGTPDDYLGISSHTGEAVTVLGKTITFGIDFSVCETENHTLMINVWRYLVQNYIQWAASLPAGSSRYDARLAALYNSNPVRYTNTAEYSDLILQVLGRVPYNDMFETNAKPYAGYSLNALQCYYSCADKLPELRTRPDYAGNKIAAAAGNAIDYLAATYAFQSLEGKRSTPMRRNWEDYGDVLDFYAGDYPNNIFGVLSGAYVFDDTNGEEDYRSPVHKPVSTTWKRLFLKSLKVNITQDVGQDELKLRMWVDGSEIPGITKKVETNETMDMYSSYYFQNECIIKLWDMDSLSKDDGLGALTISPLELADGVKVFEGKNYKYTLEYAVEPALEMTSPNMVTLHSLFCANINDNAAEKWDETKIKVYVDGVEQKSHSKDMKKGSLWSFNLVYTYNESVVVKLYDRDKVGKDDHLGTITITNTVPREQVYGVFDEAHARYFLRYSNMPSTITYKPYHYTRIGQEGGFALWSALYDYRIDPAIHDFMLHKYNGYWTRIQSRYTTESYPVQFSIPGSIILEHDITPIKPLYFNADGSMPMQGSFRPVTQLYFTTPDYVNAAGGKFEKYYEDTFTFSIAGIQVAEKKIDQLEGHHVIVKPYTILPKGDVQFTTRDDYGAMIQKVIGMKGNGCNLSTYKNVSIGLDYGDDTQIKFPIAWNPALAEQFNAGAYKTKILHFPTGSDYDFAGYYLVIHEVAGALYNFINFTAGIWEILPESMYPSAADLKNALLASHSESRLIDGKIDYVMAATRETIRIDFGKTTGNHISSILTRDGAELNLTAYYMDDANLRQFPLMSVLEVDSNYNFTGYTYAYAAGDGRVEINNPHIGAYLTIDSSDYRNPKRTSSTDLFLTEAGEPAWRGDNASLERDYEIKTKSAYSLRVLGTGYMRLLSPRMSTSDILTYSRELSVDIYVPQDPDPNVWYGSLEIYFDIPPAGIYSAYLGYMDLSKLSKGAWNTVTFILPEAVYQAIAGDYPDMEIRIVLNTNITSDQFRLCNLRFTGQTTRRTVLHHEGSLIAPYPTGIFSFDNVSDWSTDNALLQATTDQKVQGTGAMQVTGTGYIPIKSRTFASHEVVNETSVLSLDVYVPGSAEYEYWKGAISLLFSCPQAGLHNVYIGPPRDLTMSFKNEFNQIRFDVPEEIRNALKGNYSDCTLEIDLNVNQGPGTFILDNLNFTY